MQHQSGSNHGRRRWAIAGAAALICAPLQASAGAAGCQCSGIYSVINLGEAGLAALLNERGQAAFGSFGATGYSNSFFDGDRLHNIGSLGGGRNIVDGLNRHGVVVGESDDAAQRSNTFAFAWTVAGGMRALPGASVSSASAINDRGYVVGMVPAPGITARALRWNPNGSVTPLGPLPLSLSAALDINQNGLATGFGNLASGAIHATLWDRSGNLTDLGTLGGELAFGMHINDSGAVAGVSANAANDRMLGFFWSRDSAMVPIGAEGGGARTVADLNNRGEVVGDTLIGARGVAYQWSLERGLVPLPAGSATRSDVVDINNNSEMVGVIERHPAEGGDIRAVRWPGRATAIDLNTRLHRPPKGLVLETGAAINDDGTILAYSNAGLVMLRPGKLGTDAPVLGPLVGLPELLEVGREVALTLGFVDNNRAQTHTASATWSDGCPSSPPSLRQARGVGEVRLQHRFCAAGWYTVTARVTDSGGRSTQLHKDIVVDAPSLASVSGKGTLGHALAGRRRAAAPLQFVLWAPVGSGASQQAGRPVVMLAGPFHFRSDQVTATAVGAHARLAGTGTFNGRHGYRFVLQAHDGAGEQATGTDRLSVRITHVDAVTGAELVDYDNGAQLKAGRWDAPDSAVVTEGGLRLRRE